MAQFLVLIAPVGIGAGSYLWWKGYQRVTGVGDSLLRRCDDEDVVATPSTLTSCLTCVGGVTGGVVLKSVLFQKNWTKEVTTVPVRSFGHAMSLVGGPAKKGAIVWAGSMLSASVTHCLLTAYRERGEKTKD
eukprot:TRINITY_DN18371_c0_g1_i1.p1 TRINITY_DN18371_c0_g1~~TRINITY_DN18371_c0_g1_i1.p1  ORF type:complete len:132 (+),score=24.44 TRINITY_DN18371_c0_g1_i1:176-571(+)